MWLTMKISKCVKLEISWHQKESTVFAWQNYKTGAFKDVWGVTANFQVKKMLIISDIYSQEHKKQPWPHLCDGHWQKGKQHHDCLKVFGISSLDTHREQTNPSIWWSCLITVKILNWQFHFNSGNSYWYPVDKTISLHSLQSSVWFTFMVK